MTPSLSPQVPNLEQLEEVGRAAPAIVGMFQGIFIMMASKAIYTLTRQPLPSLPGPRKLLLAVVIIFSISTTITFACYEAYYVLTGTAPRYTASLTFSQRDALYLDGNTMKLMMAFDLLSRLNYLLSDLIVVWRAWILLQRRVSRVVLAFFILVSLGLTTLTAICSITGVPSFISGDLPLFIMVITLVFTNVITTGVIAYKTWVYRTEIKAHLSQANSKSRVEKILILLLDSGLIYCTLWILYALLEIFGGNPAYEAMSALMPFASAIYPVIVILVVEHGKTRDMSRSEAVSRSIRFASDPRRPHSNSWHSTSIIQSIADQIASTTNDEESMSRINDEIELQVETVGDGSSKNDIN